MPEFNSREDVEQWLAKKPREVAVTMAARAVLRAVPLIGVALEHHVFLPVWRSAAESWASARFPELSGDIEKALRARVLVLASRIAASQDVITVASHARSAAAETQIEKCAKYAAQSVDTMVRAIADAAVENESNSARATGAYAAIYALAYGTVSADAAAIELGQTSAHLACAPLWQQGAASWSHERWERFRSAALVLDEAWEVWTDWYEARLVGDSDYKELEIGRVIVTDRLWDHGAKTINLEIKKLIAMYGAGSFDLDDTRDLPPLPHISTVSATVPAQKPAAVEPVWDKGRLRVPSKAAKSNLSRKKLVAAFAALRAELLELASDVNAEGNIDKRPADFLQHLASRIPETAPRQDELFRLGHAETIFAGYARVVTQEWPDFLAARYHAVSLQFDRTMRQSPLWRDFVANAAKQTMSAAQVSDSTSLATEAAKALRQEEAPAFVDSIIPRALEELADALLATPEPDAVGAGKELLAADLVESVNNTLKPIAEVALASAGDYAEEFGKSFKKAAKKQGKIDGEKALKWLRRIAIGGVAAGAGSFVPFSHLIAKFPEAFSWLERVLHVLK